jgi:hypothetical protein
MALDTYVVLIRHHASEADALADVEALCKLLPGYGKATFVNRVANPIRRGGAIGLAAGLAVGAFVAVARKAAVSRAARLLGDAIGRKRPDKVRDHGRRRRMKVAPSVIEAMVDAALPDAKQPATPRLQAVIDAVKQDIDRQDGQEHRLRAAYPA